MKKYIPLIFLFLTNAGSVLSKGNTPSLPDYSGDGRFRKHMKYITGVRTIKKHNDFFTDYLPLTGGTVTGITTLSAGSEGSIAFYPFTSSSKYWQMNKGDVGTTVWAFGFQNPAGTVTSDYIISSYTDVAGWKERFKIVHATGNVGIGTSNPASILEIRSGGANMVTLNPGAYQENGFMFQDNGANRWELYSQSSGANTDYFSLYNFRNNIAVLTALNNGNIGFGVTSPLTKLHIKGTESALNTTAPGAGAYGGIHLQFPSGGNDNSVGITFGGASTGSPINETVAGMWVQASDQYGTRLYLGTTDSYSSGAKTRMLINEIGNVGIGTTTPSEKLSVNGNIRAKKIIVQTGWSDYVFADNYWLRPLSSLESFIKQNKHLPDVPSAKEVEEKGISVGDNQALLLKKIEELTLYILQQQKQIDQQGSQIKLLTQKIIGQ